MATVLSRFADILGEADFDIDSPPDGSNDKDVIEYQNKIQAIIDKFSGLGGLGCMVGCMPEYLQCKKDNPSYPAQAICDSYLSQCIANCQTQ